MKGMHVGGWKMWLRLKVSFENLKLFFIRKLLEISSMIQYIYTTTKVCVPDSFDVCSDDAVKLWNFTYVQGVDGMKQISFAGKDGINFIDVTNSNELRLKCYSGEPQLEKIMDDGEIDLENL